MLFSGPVVKNQQKSFSLDEILLVSSLIKHLEVELLGGGQALSLQQCRATPVSLSLRHFCKIPGLRRTHFNK